MKLEDLQANGVDVVKKAIGFNDESDVANIYSDDGTKNEEMEESLKKSGWCIAVSLPIAGNVKAQQAVGSTAQDGAAGVATVDALTVITLRTNPKKNIGDGAKNILASVASIMRALLGDKPTFGKKGYFFPEQRAFEPDYEDVGNITYDIRVFRNVSI